MKSLFKFTQYVVGGNDKPQQNLNRLYWYNGIIILNRHRILHAMVNHIC